MNFASYEIDLDDLLNAPRNPSQYIADEIMDTIEQSNDLTLAQAKAILERNGLLVVEAPETDDEKLDRYWADFVRFASSIENLTRKGARLPARKYLDYSVALVIRAAHSVAESAQ